MTGIPRYFRRAVLTFVLALSFIWLYSLRYGDKFQHRYNAFSCPGYIAPSIKSNGTTPVVPSAPQTSDHVVKPDFQPSPFAYVFYATAPDYACSVLVNIDRLNNIFNTTHRIIVLVRPDLASQYLTALTAQNATVIPYDPPSLADNQVDYYRDVLLKLVAFRLHHYIPSLQRVLILDSDQIILQSLDHVFHLPAVDVAAPRAYWLDSGVTSAFLLISLSDRVWNKISQSLETIGPDVFDMDVINELFKKTLLVLPGDYATLNSHWETNDVPIWWQGSAPPPPYTPPPPPPPPPAPPDPVTSTPEPQINSSTIATDQKTSTNTVEPQSLNARQLTDQAGQEAKALYKDVLEKVYADVKVLHFTALGKPWSWHAGDIAEVRPLAHELFIAQFQTWQEASLRMCNPTWSLGI